MGLENKQPYRTIDLCVVATLRPDILEKTFESFIKHVIFDGKMTLRINIDHVPMSEENNNNILKMGMVVGSMATKIDFKVYVSSMLGNFAKAVKRLWSESTADYVFHLEDDWKFIKNIDLNECVERMENENFDYMRFPKKNAPHLNKVALQPSLWKGDIVREISKYMIIDKDPEKQLRTGQGNDELDKILIELQNKGLKDYCSDWCCEDIGREWRTKHGLEKWNKNKGNNYITWTKV